MKTETAGRLETLRTFFVSPYFMFGVFALACVFAATGAVKAGLVVFIVLISVIFAVCDDIAAIMLPAFLLMLFMMKSDGKYDGIIGYIWLLIVIVPAIVFHLIAYRKKPAPGKALRGLLAVTAAVTLGGLGSITAKEYFTFSSLYHIAGLGIGMVVFYLFLSGAVTDSRKKVDGFYAVVFSVAAAFACFMVFEHYLVNIREVIETGRALSFQWRNNVSTFLMIALPFPFYLSLKKPLWLWLGLLSYASLLLAGSRGGLIFGSVEFVLCMVYVIVCDKKKRKRNIAVLCVTAALMLVFISQIYTFLMETTERMLDKSTDIRIRLLGRAIEDFKESPLFGKGLSYTGNYDVWPPKKFALCWYHSSPFQVIGSLGIFGVLAYGYRTVNMVGVFFARRSRFGTVLAISALGLEMMSLVNPGIFCPFPYAFLLVIILVIAEKYNLGEEAVSLTDAQAVGNAARAAENSREARGEHVP